MYKLIQNLPGLDQNVVQRLADNTFIPFDPANTDYQLYLKWLDGYEKIGGEWVKTSDANTPLPAD